MFYVEHALAQITSQGWAWEDEWRHVVSDSTDTEGWQFAKVRHTIKVMHLHRRHFRDSTLA